MHFTDQLHNTVSLAVFPPRRIVSLVPSQTELLADLGLEEEVVGITKFCVHPERWFSSKKRVGGTKTVNLEKVAALQPDLIIGNKEENVREQIEWLEKRFPVWMSDVRDLNDACNMIEQVGALTGKPDEAAGLSEHIRTAFEALPVPEQRRPCAYFIWRKPYMVAGSDTFIHHMLERAGFENVFGRLSRYPEVTLEQVAEARPDVLLLSSEPYPFAEKHFSAFQEYLPNIPLRIVDGEMFSWYGSRLLFAPAYFLQLRRN